MNSLKRLELFRLLKELDFVESDYKYQSEFVRIFDIEFLNRVTEVVRDRPEIKLDIYRLPDIRPIEATPESITPIDQDDILVSDVDPAIKKIYREIVKSTHPDSIKSNALRNLYIEATSAYEGGDLTSLIRIGTTLSLDFDFDDNLIEEITQKISIIRERINFIKSTYTYKWVKSPEENRNQIVLEYIKSSIK